MVFILLFYYFIFPRSRIRSARQLYRQTWVSLASSDCPSSPSYRDRSLIGIGRCFCVSSRVIKRSMWCWTQVRLRFHRTTRDCCMLSKQVVDNYLWCVSSHWRMWYQERSLYGVLSASIARVRGEKMTSCGQIKKTSQHDLIQLFATSIIQNHVLHIEIEITQCAYLNRLDVR